MSMPTLDEVKKRISKISPVDCEFKVGDRVRFTNSYGVKFSKLFTVIGFAETPINGRFIHIDYDCYWFPTKSSSLELVKS